MSWDDDDFGNEYAKFRFANPSDSVDSFDGNIHVLYCEILYDTIKDYTSNWNKARKKVQVYIINRCALTPRNRDDVEYKEGIWLDMGARLYKAVKGAYQNKWKYVKIVKISNPNDKFDVEYYVSEYKLVVQSKLDDVAKKQVRNKGKK